jgi:cytochrome c553
MRRSAKRSTAFWHSLETIISMRVFSIKLNLLTALFTLGALASTNVMAEGDPQAGKEKSVTCAACHGQDGNSINPEWPSLAGQNETYILRSLHSFKDNSRQNVLMNSQVVNLDEESMQDLAAYYASQTPALRTTSPELVQQGERLYRGGNLERGVSACTACHGPLGHGNPGAGYPSVTGQHATYTTAQLLAYRANVRQTDPNRIMRDISSLMTEDEIRAVASYMQGLR